MLEGISFRNETNSESKAGEDVRYQHVSGVTDYWTQNWSSCEITDRLRSRLRWTALSIRGETRQSLNTTASEIYEVQGIKSLKIFCGEWQNWQIHTVSCVSDTKRLKLPLENGLIDWILSGFHWSAPVRSDQTRQTVNEVSLQELLRRVMIYSPLNLH